MKKSETFLRKFENVSYGIQFSFLFQTCAAGSLNAYDLKQLISAAATSAVCFVEARKAFKHSYATAKFFIEGPLVTGDANDGITETDKQIIHIKTVDSILNTVKLFGDMVQFAELSFADVDETNAATISAALVENCANSLIELQVKSCHGSILDNFQQQFPNVNVTAFTTHSSNALQIGTGTWRLSKLFPNARQLSVDLRLVDYWTVVGDSFPYLKMLSVVHPKPTYSAVPDISSLLNNSRSLNSLTLSYSSLGLLKMASESLPELNVLQLNEFADDFYTGTDINFRNVSNLRIATSTNNVQVPEKLNFDGVKGLTVSLSFNFTDKWLQFVRNTSRSAEWLNIKTLAINADELKTIAQDSAHMKLATIASDRQIPTAEIRSFLEHSQRLEWLEMECPLINTAQRNALEGWVAQTWLYEYLTLTDQLNRMRFIRYDHF